MATTKVTNQATEEMTEMRTGQGIHPMQNHDPRELLHYNMNLREQRRNRVKSVRVQYVGRKRRSGSVVPALGEDIDVVIPDQEQNALAVEDFVDGLDPHNPNVDAEQLRRTFTPDTIHMIGDSYHFKGGEVSEVLPEHLPFLLDHHAYSFSVVKE